MNAEEREEMAETRSNRARERGEYNQQSAKEITMLVISKLEAKDQAISAMEETCRELWESNDRLRAEIRRWQKADGGGS